MDRNAATFTRYHDHDPDTDDAPEPDSIDAIRLSIEYLRESFTARKPADIAAELTRISDRLAAIDSFAIESTDAHGFTYMTNAAEIAAYAAGFDGKPCPGQSEAELAEHARGLRDRTDSKRMFPSAWSDTHG